uniref:CN hydrolase domain-containing protein n=1 Tax=Heterorhabditis bacteriophora TaxID=37862 RepID=A0A1I7X7N3_HETBA
MMPGMSFRGKTILPQFAFIGGQVKEGVAISIDNRGIITDIGGPVDANVIRLDNETFYERAGFDFPPLHPVQERFISSYDDFISNLNELQKNSKFI